MMTNQNLSPLLVLFFALVACTTETLERPELTEEKTQKKQIQTDQAPDAIGPYSQAIQVGQTVYLAGQIAIDPATNEMVTDSIEAETRQVMVNLEAVLQAAGMDFSHVVKTTIFMQDLANFSKVNEIYGSYFEADPPARETVQVAALPKNASLEISMIAVKTQAPKANAGQ